MYMFRTVLRFGTNRIYDCPGGREATLTNTRNQNSPIHMLIHIINFPLDKMATNWRQIGDKQLSKPMLTSFTDAYMRH